MKFPLFALFIFLLAAPALSAAPEQPDDLLLGGYQERPLEEAHGLRTYLLAKLREFQELSLVKYERQVVGGFNHKLTFQGGKQRREVFIFEDMDGGLSLPITGQTVELEL